MHTVAGQREKYIQVVCRKRNAHRNAPISTIIVIIVYKHVYIQRIEATSRINIAQFVTAKSVALHSMSLEEIHFGFLE